MASRSLTENETNDLLGYLNTSKHKLLTSTLLKDSDKVLNVEVVETMWRYFRNAHPIGQSLANLPEDPQITAADKLRFETIYQQLIPILIRLIQTQNGYLQIVSNFRNQNIIQIIKIGPDIYVLRRNVKTNVMHFHTDFFFSVSNKIGYFGHMIFVILMQLSPCDTPI